MKKLITLLLTIVSLSVYSQSPTDTIDYDNVNITYLETLLKEKLDNYRSNYDLPILVWEDTISDGARNHSKEMSNKGYLYHAEMEYWNGEACGYAYKSGVITYEVVVIKLVTAFINSAPHRKILLYDDNTAGLGVFLDKDKKRFYFTYRSDAVFDTEEELVRHAFVN